MSYQKSRLDIGLRRDFIITSYLPAQAGRLPVAFLDIQILDALGVGLDEFFSGSDFIAH